MAVAGALEMPTDLDFMPVLTIPQDLQVWAVPVAPVPSAAAVYNFEAKFPRLRLVSGVPAKDGFGAPELATATNPTLPFHLQIATPAAGGGLLVWQGAALDPAVGLYAAQQIPEGGEVPFLWPLFVLTKLVDDFKPDANGHYHTVDPASLMQQGDPKTPVVVMQGITEIASADATKPDTLYEGLLRSLGGQLFDAKAGRPTVFAQDHITVLIRPSVICFDSLFDPSRTDKRGTLVTPYLTGDSADLPPVPSSPIVPADLLTNDDPKRRSIQSLVSNVVAGKVVTRRALRDEPGLPPMWQAWTVPNETGACSGTEGATDVAHLSCTLKPRPLLYSQGTRAVIEVVPAEDPPEPLHAHRTGPARSAAVPAVSAVGRVLMLRVHAPLMSARAILETIDDRGLSSTPRAACVLVIGNFDGVHRGHQAVLREAVTAAQQGGLSARVLTFDPHPAAVVSGGAPPLLTTLERRAELMGELGVERVYVRRFDATFAAWQAERFAEELVVGLLLEPGIVVAGKNFRFGAKRSGDLTLLAALGAKLGFEVRIHNIASDESGLFSSFGGPATRSLRATFRQ